MGEWKECLLGDVIIFNYGKSLPVKKRNNGDIPVYSSAGLTGRHNKALVDSKGLIIGRKGTIGKVYKSESPFYAIDTSYYVLPNNDVYDFDFLFFLLGSIGLDELNEDSAVPGLNRDTAYSQEISLPPLPEQQAIASVFSSLDDKIDLLHHQNKTLEAMAETLFRQWFVEEAQEDWEEIVITEFFEIRDGTHDSPKQSHAGKPLITSKHIGTNQLDIKNAYLISEDDFHNVNKRSKVETNDILFSMIGTIGLTYLEQSETVDYAIKNIGLFKTSQNPDWRYYTFLWINSSLGKEFIHEYRSGSTQEYIALGSLRSIVFDAPPLNLLLEFNKVIHTYFQKIKNNMLQIHTLEKLRDTLLPKLMSGEVMVAT